jgi:hypothetical protein
MTKNEEGRFCSSCQQTVIDFSFLSDTELHQYFRSRKHISCGRFHNSQLNKEIIVTKRRSYIWTRFYKPVAAILAFVSMKYSHAAINRNDYPTSIYPSAYKEVTGDNKIIISGVVTNAAEEPLENAEVFLDNRIVARTDKDGKYEFEFTSVSNTTTYLLMFSYKGLATVVRSYNPVMLSTSYNVTLGEPGQCCHTMGPVESGCNLFLPTIIVYKKNEITLSARSQSMLTNELAGMIRSNPGRIINIISYAQTSAEHSIAQSRQEKVKEYLIEKEGMDPGRFRFIIKPGLKEQVRLMEIEPDGN